MKNFSHWPDKGIFQPWTVLVTILLIITAFIGIGQVPLFFAILDKIDGEIITNLPQKMMVKSLGENYFLTLILIPFVVCFGMMLLAFKYIHKSDILSFFTNRPRLDWKRIAISFGAWGAILMLMQVVLIFTEVDVKWNFNSDEFWNLLLISLLLLPIQTTCEELIFRSYLFKAFGGYRKPILVVFICSLLFAFMHIGNPEIDQLGTVALIFYLWTGLFLGLITFMDEGLELAIGYHAMNNIFAAVILTNDWQAFQTSALWIDTREPTFGWEMLATLFLFQPILFLFFAKMYKWDLKKLYKRDLD